MRQFVGSEMVPNYGKGWRVDQTIDFRTPGETGKEGLMVLIWVTTEGERVCEIDFMYDDEVVF
jgi:hypothetical protein